MRARTLIRMLLVIVALAIAVLSLVPRPPAVLSSVSDKAKHVFAYWVLSLLIAGSIGIESSPGVFLSSFCAGALYGGMLELLQHLVGRDPQWLDLAADAAGSLGGAAVAVAVLSFVRLP